MQASVVFKVCICSASNVLEFISCKHHLFSRSVCAMLVTCWSLYHASVSCFQGLYVQC